MSTGSHCQVRSRTMNVVSHSLCYWKDWLFPSYSLVPMDRVMETVSSCCATATSHVYDKTFSLCRNLLSNLQSRSLKSSCTYFSPTLPTFTDIPEVSTLQVETYSRTCNQPFLTTTNHCTLHSQMCRSRSKHSHDANPILTTLWIMWLLPTSSSIPKLFVFLGFYPKWQIGASEIELSSPLLFQCMIVIWVWAKHPGSDKGVWCQGLLCVPLFVWGSQNVCRVPCSCFPPPIWVWFRLTGQI